MPLKRVIWRLHMLITGEGGYSFEGWGMKTSRELPWNGGIGNEFFLKASHDVKTGFEFSGDGGLSVANVDNLLWRHWVVSYAVRHVVEFAKKPDLDLVECGVCDGLTAFFTLRELSGQSRKGSVNDFRMHLYDAWMPVRRDDLSLNEKGVVGSYDNIDIDRVKRNLSEFADNVVYHKGYIPASLSSRPVAPRKIEYLHIDLNSARATLEALKFFFPRVQRGGVILFDDYGSVFYKDTKKIVDKFFADKPGILMPLPTGQAIYYR